MSKSLKTFQKLLPAFGLAVLLSGCGSDFATVPSGRGEVPIPEKLRAEMEEKGMSASSPILVRIFKKESELEVWKQDKSGRYALLKTYPICRWSGQLGPKNREGDRQAPEGFYKVASHQLNPNSQYFLSFDLGYPNAYDKAHGGSGSHLMVHGQCTSRGCYAMTDIQIAELYALSREALRAGQGSFQVQAMPFRMTPKNLAAHRLNPNIAFWRQLKEGSDHFEVTKLEPKVAVCGRKYIFNAQVQGGGSFVPTQSCPSYTVEPSIAEAVAEKNKNDETKIAELILNGEKPIKVQYADGATHSTFTRYFASDAGYISLGSDGYHRTKELGIVSRPEAIQSGTQIVALASTSSAEPKKTSSIALAPAQASQNVAQAHEEVAAASSSSNVEKTSSGFYSFFKPTPAQASEIETPNQATPASANIPVPLPAPIKDRIASSALTIR